MTRGAGEIEQIVAEVVRRLGAQPATPPRSDTQVDELVLRERVISLATITDQLDGKRRIRVPSNAVLTPSAIDELRRQRIEVEYEDQKARKNADRRTAFVATVGHADIAKQITSSVDPRCAVMEFDCEEDAVSDAVAAVSKGSRAAVWSGRPALTVCLANRHADIWSVNGTDLQSLSDAFGSVPVNLLVIDPRQQSPFLQKSVFREYLQQ